MKTISIKNISRNFLTYNCTIRETVTVWKRAVVGEGITCFYSTLYLGKLSRAMVRLVAHLHLHNVIILHL